MNEYETTLTKIYRCSIEDTGNDIRIFKPFSIPMLPDEPIVYTTEPEIAIKFSESSMKDFLRDYEQWMDVLSVSIENPMIAEQYERFLVLVGLLK